MNGESTLAGGGGDGSGGGGEASLHHSVSKHALYTFPLPGHATV